MQNRVMGTVTDDTHRFLPAAGAGGVTRFEALKAQTLLSQSGDFLVRFKRCEDVTINRSVIFTTHATCNMWEWLAVSHVSLLM